MEWELSQCFNSITCSQPPRFSLPSGPSTQPSSGDLFFPFVHLGLSGPFTTQRRVRRSGGWAVRGACRRSGTPSGRCARPPPGSSSCRSDRFFFSAELGGSKTGGKRNGHLAENMGSMGCSHGLHNLSVLILGWNVLFSATCFDVHRGFTGF